MQRQRKVLVVSWLHILLALCHMELLVKIQSPFNKVLRWALIIKQKLRFGLVLDCLQFRAHEFYVLFITFLHSI